MLIKKSAKQVKYGNKALNAGIGYTIGNILIKGMNFLCLPVFSRLLTTSEFGIYNVFVSYDGIMVAIISMAIYCSIRSANYKFRGEINQYTSSVSLIFIINAVCWLVFITFTHGFLSRITGFSRTILYLIVIYSFGNGIVALYNNRINLEYSYKQYLLIALINSIGNVTLSFFLVFTLFNDKREVGRILGCTIPIFVLSVFLLVNLYKKAKPQYNKTYWNFALRYSLPIVPNGVAQTLLSQFDRIMIRNMIGDSAAGIYSLAGNLNLILIIITDSISTAWSTWFYAEIDKKNKKNIQKKAIQLSVLFLVLTIGLMALSPELILFLGGKEYDTGKFVAIPMLLDAFVLFLYNVIIPSEYYTGKTTYIMTGTIIAATINMVTNYIFIKQFGYYAAAYTTLFSYVCYLILHTIISYRLVNFFVIPLKWMFLFISIITLMAAVDLFFVDILFLRVVICSIVILPMGLILLRNVITEKEKIYNE